MCVPIVDEVIDAVKRGQRRPVPADPHRGGGAARDARHRRRAERHISAHGAFAATSGDIIVVHDGVRPPVRLPRTSWRRPWRRRVEHGAAMVAAAERTSRVKLASADDGFIEGSLDCAHSWLGQTPQAFLREHLERAYVLALRDGYARVVVTTPTSSPSTAACASRILPGHDHNIKITTCKIPRHGSPHRGGARRTSRTESPVSRVG